MDEIILAGYDPAWAGQFADIAGQVRAAFADGPLIAVEHIGSTSVTGLAAKPIVDIDVIVPSHSDVPDALAWLAVLGYTHQGDLGIAGREAFERPPGAVQHHLYLCVRDNAEYRRHVTFRDYLRKHRDEAKRYEALKRDLAAQFPTDRAAYSAGKAEFVEAALQKANAKEEGKRVEHGRSRHR